MKSRSLSHRARLEACLSNGTLDRPPVALWRHFPVDDQTPGALAAAALDFQRTYDFDLVKVTPASSFCLKDWGSQDEWHGDPEGTRTYTRAVIQTPEDWLRLRPLDPSAPYLGAQLECLRLLTSELGPEVPVVQTIFSPLAQAKNLVGKANLMVHLRRYPEAVHAGLRVIAETTQRFVEAALQMGIAGVFFAVQHAQYGILTEVEYDECGNPYDLQALESARTLWLNMLHLHGEEIMFDRFIEYPVAVINWHDRDTDPGLSAAQERFGGVVCGGLRRENVVLGTPETVQAEAADALRATARRRFILGTGCVVPIVAPRANLLAVRHAVDP
jgi:uroporphyrinogen decarboxylase